jgi:D-alanyl-D-alanine carboxypeptidase/D-alanyl-D-alanine-endopeptidase (penicillin-binding protein 4)
MTTSRRTSTVAAGLAVVLAVGACSGDDDDSGDDGPSAEIGTLPDDAAGIMSKAPYATARWIYFVADAESGEVLLADRPDEMVFTGSTAKGFTVASVYETLGPDTRLTTPVYATTPVDDGVVDGDLVLVASGDLALGGRNALEGRLDHTFTADSVDHVYANFTPNATRVGDPLAGLDDLARQIADRGVTRVDGDVVIDTTIWQEFQGQDPTPPIFVNDNLVDVQVTAPANGEPATLEVTPETDLFTVESDVETVAEDGATALTVSASQDDPSTLVVSGTIAAGSSRLANYRVQQSADWARALFIEALERAGIEVAARIGEPNDQSSLAASDSYPADRQLAVLESPTLGQTGKMIMEMSHNVGANSFMCLLAVERGSDNCIDGLATVYALAEKAGIDTNELFLVDGSGADPASTTPRQMARWMQWSREQPWGEEFVASQPILGETGSLAANGRGSPAVGKVAAKVGTSVDFDLVTGRLYSKVQSLAGYLTLDDGRVLVFGLSMSGGTYPQVYEGLLEAGEDVAMVAAAFQQELSDQ